MNCKMIKTWILTDYLDGELGLAKRQALETHLKSCRSCADLLEKARSTAIKPFENIKYPNTQQEYLWSRIKTKIEKEQKQCPRTIIERTIHAFRVPKPIFALSTCAALLLAVFVLTQARTLYQKTHNRQSAAAALTEQLDYFASDETSSLGAGQEDYFL